MLALQAHSPCDLWSSLQWLPLPTNTFTQNREPFTLENCQDQRLIRRQKRLSWPGAGQTSVLTTNLLMCNWPLLSPFLPFFLPIGFYPSLLLLVLPLNTCFLSPNISYSAPWSVGSIPPQSASWSGDILLLTHLVGLTPWQWTGHCPVAAPRGTRSECSSGSAQVTGVSLCSLVFVCMSL